MNDLTLRHLEEKLELMKRKAVSSFIQGKVDTTNTKNVIDALRIPESEQELQMIRGEIEELSKGDDMKSAEIAALKSTLQVQEARASTGMLRRLAQLKTEMMKTPLGEVRRTIMEYKREIKKLGSEIESFEREGEHEEFSKLQEELQRMASIKAGESEMLAKKLSFMQSTFGQCSLRLQRLKLDVGLHIYANRLKRWKNCFQ